LIVRREIQLRKVSRKRDHTPSTGELGETAAFVMAFRQNGSETPPPLRFRWNVETPRGDELVNGIDVGSGVVICARDTDGNATRKPRERREQRLEP
jgi:hypothetical protein